MKKSLAAALLIIGGLTAVFGLTILGILLFFGLMELGLLIGIVVALGAAFGADRLRVLFRKKYGLNAGVFFLCAYVPPLVGAGIAFVTVLLLDEAGYFSGFLAGVRAAIFALASLIAAGVFAAAGGVMLLISAMIERARSGKPVFGKPAALAVLILGGALLWTAMTFGLTALYEETRSAIPSVVIIAAVTFGLDLLGRVYKRSFGVGAALYYPCAYLGALGGKIYTFYVYFLRLNVDREYGFPTAEDNAFFLQYAPIETAAILVCAVGWFLIFRRRRKSL
ncbi:MAG: hypothetical protein NC299_03875 [Lachnospiraceae bacterium]|nr:hypothetical protein [Ruminococcus sp.]MCM1274485.1 hypothetical protein [Lachnospiraceae bacterium]